MVTQLQKYNGKNNFNNKVVVDYINKTVDFEIVKGNMNKFTSYYTLWYNYFIIYLIWCFVIYIIGIVLFKLPVSVSYFVINAGLVFLGIPTFLCAMLFLLTCINKEWFPKINYILVAYLKHLTYKPIYVVNEKINLDLLEKNYYETPVFENVFLEYITEGEVSELLSKVEILPCFVDNPYKWVARVHFKRKPTNKDGTLKIKAV